MPWPERSGIEARDTVLQYLSDASLHSVCRPGFVAQRAVFVCRIESSHAAAILLTRAAIRHASVLTLAPLCLSIARAEANFLLRARTAQLLHTSATALNQ